MCIVTMKSMTAAIRAKNVLNGKGIAVEILNLDPSITARGCAYGLSFSCGDKARIMHELDSKRISYGEWIGDRRVGLVVQDDISG